MPFPASVHVALACALSLFAVACDQRRPEAIPSASRGSIPPVVGSGPDVPPSVVPSPVVPSSLLPTVTDPPAPNACLWEPDRGLVKQLDPNGSRPINSLAEFGGDLVAVSDERAFHREGGRWTVRKHPGARAAGVAVQGSDVIAIDDGSILRHRDARWRRDAVPKSRDATYLADAAGSKRPGRPAWAVGFRSANAGDRIVAWTYRKASWRALKTPDLGSGSIQRLNAVASVGNGMISVGVAEAGNTGKPLVLRFDGSRWTRAQISAPKGSSWTELSGIAVVAGTFFAVGEAWLSDGLRAVAYVSDDARTWRSVAVPQPGERGERGFGPPYGPTLTAVGGTATNVYAVGGYNIEHPRGGGELLEIGLIARWDGERFVREELTSTPNEQDPIVLTDVVTTSASGTEEAIAVGLHGNGAFIAARTC